MSLSSCGGVGGVQTCVGKSQVRMQAQDRKGCAMNCALKKYKQRTLFQVISELVSYWHDFCVAILCIKHIFLSKCVERINVNNKAYSPLVWTSKITVATHHVVCILSGVGEELFITLHKLSHFLLLLQLLQMLQLPASLRAFEPLLTKEIEPNTYVKAQ